MVSLLFFNTKLSTKRTDKVEIFFGVRPPRQRRRDCVQKCFRGEFTQLGGGWARLEQGGQGLSKGEGNKDHCPPQAENFDILHFKMISIAEIDSKPVPKSSKNPVPPRKSPQNPVPPSKNPPKFFASGGNPVPPYFGRKTLSPPAGGTGVTMSPLTLMWMSSLIRSCTLWLQNRRFSVTTDRASWQG